LPSGRAERSRPLAPLVDAVGVERLVFGSYSPMFYFESAMLKVQEAALAEEQTVSIFANNALRLLSEASP